MSSELPIGMQLSGPPNSEELLFGIAEQFEIARPPLFPTAAAEVR